MTETAIIGGRLALPDGIVDGLAVVVDDARIARICEPSVLAPTVPRFDVQGRIVGPGLVDIHVHGAAGSSFADPSETAWTTITESLLRAGVTACLASISTAPIETMAKAVEFARRWMAEERPGARVLGVHLEGPYLSYEQRGAHDPSALRVPTDGSVDDLLAVARVVRMVTFAPELPGGLDLASRLADEGIVAAVGHSAAGPDVLRSAIERGVSHLTHLWSGQSTLTRVGPWRMPGLLEASLASDELTAEIIADGKHLPQELIKIAHRCLGRERLCVVSDAIPAAGMPDGIQLEIDGLPVEVRDGVAMTLDGTSFAGSTTLLGDAVHRLVADDVVAPAGALDMASRTPARAIREDGRIGSIEVGKTADLVVFEDRMRPWWVMRSGRWALGPDGTDPIESERRMDT